MAAQTTRNAASVAAKTSKEVTTNGKENVCPSSNVKGGRKVSLLSFGSVDQRKNQTGLANTRGGGGRRAVTQLYSGKKAPFHVHCDERDVAPRDGSIRCRGPAIARDDVKETRAEETSRKRSASGASWTNVEPQDGKKRLPLSKIPRRSRSNSVPAEQSQPRVVTRGSVASIESPSIQSRCSGILKRERVGGRGTSSRATETGRSASKRLPEPGEIAEQRRGGSTRTPSKSSIGAKAEIRRSKWTKAVDGDVQVASCSKDRDPFPAALLYHVEYLDDLPIVERDREKLSAVLSRNFLTERHINAEQRKLVVTFLIHLGTHCKYPSYIVYQSVKLFDLVMDTIRVETTLIQLTALASLWIALKKQENFHRIPTAKSMVALANELYVGKEDLLIKYERKILQALNFNVTFADAFTLYTHHLVNCIRFVDISDETTSFLYNTGCYLIDVTLLDEQFCRTPATLIALTAAELALGLVIDVAATVHARPRWLFWRGLLFAATSHLPDRFQDKEIDRARITMLRRLLISGKKHHGFDVVYKKYSRGRHGRISQPLLERANRVSLAETFYDP